MNKGTDENCLIVLPSSVPQWQSLSSVQTETMSPIFVFPYSTGIRKGKHLIQQA